MIMNPNITVIMQTFSAIRTQSNGGTYSFTKLKNWIIKINERSLGLTFPISHMTKQEEVGGGGDALVAVGLIASNKGSVRPGIGDDGRLGVC